KEMQEKMRTASFTFDDFLEQMGQVKEMGPLDELIGMIPGANKMKGMKNDQIDDKQIVQIEAIIQSMTKDEIQEPTMMNASRKRRIAKETRTSDSKDNTRVKQINKKN